MPKGDIVIAGTRVRQGERIRIDIPVVRRYTHREVGLPTYVVRGRLPGPRLFVCAAVHGDEINGVEIVRRLLEHRGLDRIRGTLIAVPIVNVYGFVAQTRYLPDRRDLNRSFPGSTKGSLTSRLANVFMKEIVAHATHGIDLHTGSNHRSNLPQIRACLDDAQTDRLARAFGTPVIIDSNLRDGSLRQAVLERGVPMLLYEAGEALRFDEVAIRAGLRGILSVMRELEMLPAPAKGGAKPVKPVVAHSSTWIRAPESGILRTRTALGALVEKGSLLATISDPLGESKVEVHSQVKGIVIGRLELPLVNEGDAIFHVAMVERPKLLAEQLEAYREDLELEE